MRKTFFTILYFSLFSISHLVSQNNFLDLSYCDDGSCEFQFDEFFTFVEHMSIDSLDNIYAGVTFEGTIDQVLIKIKPNGQIDNTFGVEGIFKEAGHKAYQKDNYIYSILRDFDETSINILDLELNFITRFVHVGESIINHMYFNGEYFIGSTTEGILFKYNRDGFLDKDFAEQGLYDLEIEVLNIGFGVDGYSTSSTNDIHYSFLSNNINQIPHSQILQLNNEGTLINTIELMPSPNFDPDFHMNLNFISTVELSANDNILVGLEHETYEQKMQSEYFKLNSLGQLVQDFGNEGSMLIPIPPDSLIPTNVLSTLTTQLVGELKSENLIFSYSNHEYYLDEEQPWAITTAIFIMTPEGSLQSEFGNAGFLDFDILPAASININNIITNKDHVYIISKAELSTNTFNITKLNLADLGNPVSNTHKTITAKQSISLQPNPSTTAINLLYTGPTLQNALLQIHNSNGQLVEVLKPEYLHLGKKVQINTNTFPTGNYIMTLFHDGHFRCQGQFSVLK